MFYELYDDSEEEKVLRPYVKKIKAFCLKSEFQFLESKALYWKIAPNNRFSFRAFYYIDQKVPIFHRQVWEDALSIMETDGIFQIPVVIDMCGEQQHYRIVVPSRIRCFDSKGKLSPKNVGRYHIFKSTAVNDSAIYVSEQLQQRFRVFSTFQFKGVD